MFKVSVILRSPSNLTHSNSLYAINHNKIDVIYAKTQLVEFISNLYAKFCLKGLTPGHFMHE